MKSNMDWTEHQLSTGKVAGSRSRGGEIVKCRLRVKSVYCTYIVHSQLYIIRSEWVEIGCLICDFHEAAPFSLAFLEVPSSPSRSVGRWMDPHNSVD